MAAPTPPLRNCSPQPRRSSPSFLSDQEIRSACRAAKFSAAWPTREPASTAPISTGPSPSISTATRSRLRWRLFNNRNLRGFVLLRRRAALLRNQAARRFRILFAHQNNHPTQTWERILHQRGRREIAVNARRIEQPLHHQRLRFLLRVKHFHQFLVRVGRRRVSGRIAWLCHDVSNSGIGSSGDSGIAPKFYSS